MLLDATWLLFSALSLTQDPSAPPLQRPESPPPVADVEGPAEAAPSAAAEVPEAPSEVASDPAPAEVPTPSVAAEPDPVEAEPVEAAAPVEAAVPISVEPAPIIANSVDPFAPSIPDGYVQVRKPRWRGDGLFWISGISFGLGTFFQMGDALLCGNCAAGGVERGFLAVSMATATAGGFKRGRYDAYQDAASGRGMRDGRTAMVAGAVLVGVGAVAGLANEGMWWKCVADGSGPYAQPTTDFWFGGLPCNYGVSRTVLDLASLSAATGGALLGWSLRYRKDAKAYRRAQVVSIAPQIERGFAGLQVGGKF